MDSSPGTGVSGERTKEAVREAGGLEGPLRRRDLDGCGSGRRARGLTSVVIDAVGLHQRHGDGLAQRVLVLLQLRLPEGGIPVLAEVLLGPGELPGALLLAEHRHAVQAVVADVVAGDVGQAGRHHPHATALVSWDRKAAGHRHRAQGDRLQRLPQRGNKKGTGPGQRPWFAKGRDRSQALAAGSSSVREGKWQEGLSTRIVLSGGTAF